MNDYNDELSGIFDNITPADFAPFKGRLAFDQFVTKNLEMTRMAWLAADGQINPVAVLATAEKSWAFAPTDDETLGEYVERVRGEAKKLGATWLYISRKTLVGTFKVDPSDAPDATNPEAIQEAIEKGLMSEGLFYYAERLEDGERDCRHGMMRAQDNELGELIEGNPYHQSVSFFANILG